MKGYKYVETTDEPIYVAMCSGGKDSSAMLIRLLEEGRRVDKVVFCDTTLELPETYEYILKLSSYTGIPLNIIPPNITFDDGFNKIIKSGDYKGEKRGFPWTTHSDKCWIRRDMKLHGVNKWRLHHNIFTYIGFASDETRRLNKITNNPHIFYPLVEWGMTEDDCKQYLIERDMLPPVYEYVDRTGCWLCPYQSTKSLRYIYLHHRDMWDKLREYDRMSPRGFSLNHDLNELENIFSEETQ